MTLTEIRDKMASLEGLELTGGEWPRYRRVDTKDGVSFDTDYCNSHNAVQRVIDGLDQHLYADFVSLLYFVTLKDNMNMLQATALQKCEAILKAKGLWE